MRKVVQRELGPVGGLEVVAGPSPTPGPGEVRVAVEAAAVAFVDGLLVQGRYQVRPAVPYTPGSGVAGSVSAVGAGVDAGLVGERVAAVLLGGGGWASDVVVRVEELLRVPEGVAPAVAASCLESFSTLVFALDRRVHVRPGEWVLVLGAGGGIGLAAVDVARAAGARVVAAASSPTKRDAAQAAGAEVAVGYDDLKDAVRSVTGGGADVAVDPVGGLLTEVALRSLRAYGRLCVLGFASGEVPRLPANHVLLRNRTVVGVDWGDWARTSPAEARALAADVLRRVGEGELHPPVPSVLPLVEAAEALGRLAAREVVGKVVLVP